MTRDEMDALKRTIKGAVAVAFFAAGLAMGDFFQPTLWFLAGCAAFSAAY
jgi:hypothetical protein